MKKIIIGLLAIILMTGCTGTIEEDKIEDTQIIIEEEKAEDREDLGEEGKVEYSKITAEEAKDIMDTEEVIILDVRTPLEYEEAHIEDAFLIPDYDLKDLAETELPNKGGKILLYCRSGNRSRSAAMVLIDMGYTNVHDFGGIIDWPYETVKGE